jgi:hypothetical protein
MAADDFAKFKNDQGVPEIRIGVKEFNRDSPFGAPVPG